MEIPVVENLTFFNCAQTGADTPAATIKTKIALE
jgi:hypothetical protein